MGNLQFDRQTIISAVSNKSIVWVSGTDVSSLAVGNLGRTSIYSPRGTISRLFNGRFQWDSENDGTVTGVKEYIVDVQTQPGVGTGGIGMFKFQGNGNTSINFDQGYLQSGTNYYPNNQDALNYQLSNTYYDDARAVQMVFNNVLNKAVTSARRWDLFVEREVVSR